MIYANEIKTAIAAIAVIKESKPILIENEDARTTEFILPVNGEYEITALKYSSDGEWESYSYDKWGAMDVLYYIIEALYLGLAVYTA